ncbi:MAG: hypothetical protein AB9915_03570 [Candidatus Dojkabacteria bacterium]
MIKTKTYDSLGFVEALIAIMVVGISSVVLMQIAVSTMQSMVQNDTIDRMTQYAVEGAEMAQDIANRDISDADNLFPDMLDVPVGRECFVLKEEDNPPPEGEISDLKGKFYFLKNSESEFVRYPYGEPYEYKTVATIPTEEDLFRILCLQYNSEEEDPKYVIAKVIVGLVNYDGSVTKGNEVKDYTYFTVIKL